MKCRGATILVSLVLLHNSLGQTYSVIDEGAHHRIWSGEQDGYTELETGMNYFDPQENRWKPSSVEIIIGRDGASATRGLHRAYFSGNLNEPSSVVWTTPEDQQIKTRVLGLSYYCRATHRSVWIAELRPEVSGVLHPPNRVVYADVFDNGVLGEVHYVYTKSRFSATVVLLGQVPPPSDWGLDPNTSSLEVVTELFDLPAVEKSVREVPVNRDGQAPMPDEQLKLGSAEIGEGRAFRWDNENPIPVAKTLTRIDGRDLLFESVDYISAKPEIDALPAMAGMMKPSTVVQNGRSVPAPRQARAAGTPAPTTGKIQLAAGPFQPRGFWVDWEGTLSSGTNDYVFAPNHTTYISGQVNLSNTNYLMGGTVIKFAPTNNAGLTILGQLICQTAPYEMAVLTARDDHSVGSPVGTNALSGRYASVALQIPGYPSTELSYVRIAHANKAVYYSYSLYDTTHNINHSQFAHCDEGVIPHNVTVLMRNCLMSGVGTNFLGSQYYPSSVRCEQLTVSGGRLNENSYVTLYLTNALLVNLVPAGAGYSASSAGVRSDSGSSVFSVVGAGAHYLPAASSHRGAGVTNINPSLAATLATFTVDAPVVITNRYTTNVTFAPQAQRGKATGQTGYTVGYWYPPIDYCFSGAVLTNATAVLTNGVAVAGFGEVGMRLQNDAVLASEGTPDKRNHILRYSTVQEQSTNWGGGSVVTNRLIEGYRDSGNGPTARFRFTDFETLAGGGYLLYSAASGAVFGTLSLRDCELNSGITRVAGTEGGRVWLTNNLFVGVEISFRDQPAINAYNNLFHRGAADVVKASSTNAWTFKDNVFDRVAVTQSTALTHDYSGYITNAVGQWLTNSGSNDVFTNKFGHQTGAFGQFYQPSTTNIFINEGSTTAHGLYHYTVQTNNVKETNSIVDLGYHRVAANAQGQPLDSDGDGIADYLEDPDADGFTDPGEYSFANPVISVPNSVNYMRGSPPKRLNSTGTAYDIDGPNFGGGQLTVWTVVFANINDRLGINHEGTNAAQIGVEGSTVSYGGVTIGSFSGGAGDTPLVVTLNGYASNAVVQALVRNITFHNVSSTNALSSRLLQYTLSDGTGGAGTTFQIVNIICAQGIDAMLLIDISQSMETSEFAQAKAAASNFVSRLNFTTDRVGLISFAGYEYLNSPLTNNGTNVQSLIMGLTQTNGTRFHPPLDLGRTNLTATASNVMPVILILSDGQVGGAQPGASPEEKATNRVLALEAAAKVKSEGIRLIALAYGTQGGIDDGTNLMRIFATSEGDYYYAPEVAEIETRYDEIADGLCRGLTPPQVAITRPFNPTELRGPATFRIETKTSDSDGFIKRVQFFNGSTSLGSSTNPPFQRVVSSLAPGTYSFTAVATDDDNLSTTSSPPVVVTITNCFTNALFSLSLDQSAIFSGLSTTGRVAINGPAPRGGQTILLSCTNPYVSIPPTVTITQSATNVAFRINTRSATNDLTAPITASLYGSTLTTNLTLYATNGHALNVFSGQCGPMDVVFVRTLAKELGGNDDDVWRAISNSVNVITLASGGDYQLGLISFTTNIYAQEQLALTNRQSLFTQLGITPGTPVDGANSPWDEALNTILNNLSTNGRPRQVGDFTNKFRAHARKVVVLITHAYPMGFDDDPAFAQGIDDVNAHRWAMEAWLKGIEVAAVLIRDNTYSTYPATYPTMYDLALTTGGPLVWTDLYWGEGLEVSLPHALSRCGADLGGVVFVRGDARQNNYAAFPVNDSTRETSAKDAALFDTSGIDGAVTGVRFRRNGQVLLNHGSRFDMQLGVRSVLDTNLTSFGIPLPNAHTNPVSRWYDAEWELPFSFYPDLQQHFDDHYRLELRDRADGACGDNFEIVDSPAAGFPLYRNTLTFKVLRPLQIPQGRCRDFILTGTNLPVSETWTITLFGQRIASSGLPNGWSVEHDYTTYKGFNICSPSNAVVAKEYELRYQDSAGQGSALFEVVPAGTVETAPVLNPLELSSALVGTNVALTVSLSLDGPAPAGGAAVGLLSTLSNAVPTSITIPAGETAASVAIRVTQPVTSNTTHLVGAFYNGERQAAFTIVHQTEAPAAPVNLQVWAEPLRMSVTWDPEPTALFYIIERADGGCGNPFTVIADRYTETSYIDTVETPFVDYCYIVSAVNSLGTNTSACDCALGLPGELLTPIITPPGGKFYGSVLVTITNTVYGTDTYYSTNGFWPTNQFPEILNYVTQYNEGTVLTFTTNTVLKARAYSGGLWGPLASRDFVIKQARPLSCGSNVSFTLSSTNWPSPLRSPNYNSERFIFTGGVGTNVTIKVTAQTAPHVILIDPAGVVVAQTTAFHPSETEVVHTCAMAGSYIVEVTPHQGLVIDSPEFSISLDCAAVPKLRVVVVDGGVAVPNGGEIDMGITAINTNLSKTVMITNWGATTLTVTNFTVLATPPFSSTPFTNASIPAQGFTNITVSFNSGTTGVFTGMLTFNHNDLEEPFASPYAITLLARANPPGVPPKVGFRTPTNGQIFSLPAIVTLTATNTVTNTTSLDRTYFYAINASGSKLLGYGSSPGTNTISWTNTIEGPFTLRTVAVDTNGRVSLPHSINVEFNNPPIVRRDRFAIRAGTSDNFLDVLANDFDPDRDPLKVSATSGGSGTISLDDGRIFYTAPGSPGLDSFTYTADDGRGGTATTNVLITVMPSIVWADFEQEAQINFPTNETQITAPIEVTGTAGSPYLRSYRLQYQPYRYPPPRWTTFAEGNESLTNTVLGIFDPTHLANGTYAMRLQVEDWVDGTTTTTLPILVHVGESFKVGHFTIAFTDLQIPVSGLPITLTRTYDSRDTTAGDFGAGWKLDIAAPRLEKSAVLGSGWEKVTYGSFVKTDCVMPTEPHIATVIFPNDEKFQFDAQLNLNNSGNHCVYQPGLSAAAAQISFYALPGTTGSLVPLNQPYMLDVSVSPDDEVTLHEDRGNVSISGPLYDPAEFLFKTLDEREFVFNAAGKLIKMTDRNDNTLTFGEDGIIHSSGKGIRFVRDTAGRIKHIYDPNGLNANGEPVGAPAITYTYDDAGNLTHVSRLTDRASTNSVATTFIYDNLDYPNYLTAIEDPRDPSGVPGIRNDYDDDGRLKSHTDATGKSITYVHDINGKKETIVDRLGNTNVFNYDAKGNVTMSVNALGQTNLFTYDSNGNKLSETNPKGETIAYTYDSNDLLLSISNAVGNVSFDYNSFGQVTTSVDPLLRVTKSGYDAQGNLTNVVDALNQPTRFIYDANGNLVSQIDASLNVITNRYDAFGRLTNTVEVVTGNSISYAYDLNGNRTNQITVRTLLGGGTEKATNTFIYDAQDRPVHAIEADGKTNSVVYNEIGKQEQTIDKLGRATRFAYDRRGYLQHTMYADNSGETNGYDPEGRRTFSTNRLGYVTQSVYDAAGRLTQSIFPDNTTNLTVYDAAGRVAHTVDARVTTNAFGYDNAGRRTSVTNAWGITSLQQVTTYAYDAVGNLTNMADAGNRATDHEYDDLNRRVKTIFPATVSGGARADTLTGYDLLGRRVVETNETGIVTRFGYDGAGRLIGVTNAWGTGDAGWATYAYDENGNQTNQTDALNRRTTYFYDALGRRIKRTLPGNQNETFGYDTAGNLLAHTNFNGLVITNQYDSMNRLVKKAAGSTVLETYTCDAAGRLTNRTDAAGSWRFVYDERDRLKTNTGPVGSLYYKYDVAGNLINLGSSTSNGTTNEYQYDGLNRVTNVVDQRLTGTKNTAYQYDAVGNLATLKYPNGITNLWQYDTRNYLTNLTWKLNTTTNGRFFYRLDAAGQRTNLIASINGIRTNVWKYDQLYRLTSEVIAGATPTGTISYKYDIVGNRTNRTSGIGGLTNHTLAYNTNDWLTIDSNDSNGNTTTSASITYQYDYANRLTNTSGGVIIVYDALGNRIKKVASSTTTLYLVDDRNPTGYAQVLEELTVSGSTNLSRQYTYGLDLISQRQPGNSTNFFGYDGLGSTRFLANSGGANVNTLTYDAYGTVIDGAPQTAYLFAGEQWDNDLGLYFLRARYLKPNTGRFWTMDTFEGDHKNPLSLHKFAYAGNDPSNNIDPSGNETLAGLTIVAGFQYNSRTLEMVGKSAFKVGAVRGISGFVLKTGAYTILGLTGAGVGGLWVQLSGALENNPTAAMTPEARQQLQIQLETEEQERGDQLLFHYTDSESATRIVSGKAITASAKKVFLRTSFPEGAYATDIPPWSDTHTQRQLSALFYGGNEGNDVSWFVAIERKDFTELRLPAYPNQWIRYAPAGTMVPVSIVAVGPNLMYK